MTERSIEEIQQAVRKKYAEVSCSVADRFQYLTGKAGAVALGYDLSASSDLPDEVFGSFCGVGNPLAMGSIHRGEKLLDVGCGAGLDMILASRLVGPTGRVCAIDLTPEMVEKARANLVQVGANNTSAGVAGSEAIPYDDNTFDVVISNGVLNLSPLKQQSLREIFRVLRADGRLQIADVVLNEDLPPEITNSLDAWSDWIGGAIPVRDLLQMMADAGFTDVEYVGPTGVTTSRFTSGAVFRARKPSTAAK